MKKVVPIVSYGPPFNQSNYEKASPYQLPCNNLVSMCFVCPEFAVHVEYQISAFLLVGQECDMAVSQTHSLATFKVGSAKCLNRSFNMDGVVE